MRTVSIILGLLLVFGGIGGMEMDDISLGNAFVTALGLLILAVGAPFHE